jgi:hypothetical protein
MLDRNWNFVIAFQNLKDIALRRSSGVSYRDQLQTVAVKSYRRMTAIVYSYPVQCIKSFMFQLSHCTDPCFRGISSVSSVRNEACVTGCRVTECRRLWHNDVWLQGLRYGPCHIDLGWILISLKKTPLSESASVLYRPSDRRLSAKWFADKGCHVVRRDGSLRPYSWFSRQEPLLFYQVTPQLYSRGWVEPVPDPLLFSFPPPPQKIW